MSNSRSLDQQSDSLPRGINFLSITTVYHRTPVIAILNRGNRHTKHYKSVLSELINISLQTHFTVVADTFFQDSYYKIWSANSITTSNKENVPQITDDILLSVTKLVQLNFNTERQFTQEDTCNT